MMVEVCEGRVGVCLFAILSMILSMSVVGVNGQQVPCPPRCLCFKTTVRCMFLSMDKVPPIPAETTILDLRFNRIKEIPPDTFKNLSKLHTLLLNNNQLSKLQNGVFNGLQELRYLYLYKNKLKEIEDKVFQDLNKLEQLYLHFNKIEKLSSGIFSDMTNLERLFLHNNKLKHISPGAFNHLDNLKRLRLDSNALVCDCEMMWLAKLLQEKRQVTQAAATCQFPTTMEGRPLAEINDNDFHCTKPKITEEPRDVEISFGGTVFLTCRAEGDPQPKIVWMRDSNELNLADPRYTVRDDGTLMISPMSDSDLGVYECMAKNPAGEVKSRTAKMIYNKRSVKPHFTLTPHDYDSDEGSTITLECAAEGQPKPEIAWTRDDLQLQESPRYKISSTGTLTIINLEREDTGTYKCTASNYIGIITAVAQVRVNVLPTFVTTPENLTIKSGSLARLRCVAEGSPAPVITWFKDGNTVTPGLRFSILEGGSTLEIRDAKESDSGLYTCLAQNQVGSAESNADVRVKGFGSRPPRILIRPYPISAPVGTSIELPCKADGDPVPVISWTRDGVKIATDRTHKISPLGSLRLYNISLQDSGLYSCIATNTLGEVFADGTLSVEDVNKEGAPGDRFATLAFQEASTEVDRAVNATIQSLFSSSSGPPTPYSLMRILRFPDATSRGLARSADVFERTLVNIKKHVIAGLKVNLTQDFEYKDLLSPSVVQTLANMSGCMTHQKSVNCSDMCFHSKYRTIEGTCNNLQHPMWGASLTGFRRILKPIYENGFSTPVGWTKGVKYFGFEKPSARLVSTEIISTDSITPDTEITHMVMQWGQFLDHDIDHAIPSTSLESWEGLDCKKTCAYSAPCFPMEVPENDPRIHNRRCMDFIRSSAICGSGLTSVFFDTMQPREQINQLTAFIDGSQVYGFTEERSRLLRELSNDYGLLRIGITSAAGKALLPVAGTQEVDCRRDVTESNVGCFLAGDIRVNEQVGLIAMHTIWLREHNRVATVLREINPHWDGHTLFYEARKIIGAVMQHITYKHWMPHVLGAKGMQMLGEYQGYNPNLDPSISNVFATAALRFGHSLINPVLSRLDENFKTIPQGDLPLGKAFFSPWRIVEEGGTDPLMRGLFMTAAKRKLPHENLNNQLTEQLFTVAHAVALDLAAMNIQRSRDHAIPGYNDWRRHCNLTVAENFDQLAGEISNKAVREQLEKLYGHPGNIDIWVGGILEDQVDGARVGPTFRCLLIEQFRRIRDGDRFWYENPSTFKPEQLTQIKQSSFARVLCDSGDNITEITENVFLLPKAQQHTALKTCSEIPSPELRFWYDCANDCDNDVEDVRPRRDLSLDNATEERLEGLEAVVQELQKSIKTLRRRIKQLSLHHCHDSTGVQRQDNENWVKDSCTKCHCKKGQITCTTLQCAKLHCERPYHQPGACCPVCP